jgi:hypothetical protein
MSAVVAVAIHLASELSPELAARTVKSCEAALGEEHCRLTDEPPSGEDYYAIVTADGASADGAYIVISRHDPEHPIVERHLTFLPEDAPGDRWASVGVVIAALVTAAEGPAEKPPPPRPVPVAPPPPRRPVARPKPPPAAHPARIDLLVHLSRESGSDYPRELGGTLRATFLVPRTPIFFGAAAGYAARLGPQPSLQFPLAGVGGGVRFGAPEARWALELNLFGIAQYWIISASQPGRSESEPVWRFGGSLGADLVWAVHRQWQLLAGVSAQLLTPGVTIDVGGQTAEHAPPVGAAFSLGLRFSP